MSERQATILRPDELPARERGGGASTIPLVSPKVGAREFLNGITKFGPGAAIAEHYHNCDECVVVTQGRAIVHIEDTTHEVAVGHTTFIPAGIRHYFENASDSEEMHIFWTYGSVDATRTIVATGVTTRIDEEHGTAVPV
ncbi:cupin [Mycolicibacterium agri]|uniref:Cupin n=1 Tax=Mycolicibacterium agri TaxID=36811 RepID=A0A2A7NAV6_MYCAG|nr:cupin domain-containing protein [Mycolicibacterium agri]PEG41185.1 cupin [Mycolicibacterium agri]GFG55370.1 cupin [Mycolicibacterium agri]